MAHLPIAEAEHGIDLARAIQHCTRRAQRYRKADMTSKLIIAVGGSTILVLLSLWDPSKGVWYRNELIFYSLLAIAGMLSITSSVDSVLMFERWTARYETATRALRRLR